MTWFVVDDAFLSHKKFMQVPRGERPLLLGFWTMAGIWCSKHLTDGHIPEYMIEEWEVPPEIVERLCAVVLWERTADGFVFHNWVQWQESREKVETKRAANRDRQRVKRAKDSHAVSHALQVGAESGHENAHILPTENAQMPTENAHRAQGNAHRAQGNAHGQGSSAHVSAESEMPDEPVDNNVTQLSRRESRVTEALVQPPLPFPSLPLTTPNGVVKTLKPNAVPKAMPNAVPTEIEEAFSVAWESWPNDHNRKRALTAFVKVIRAKTLTVRELVASIVAHGEAFAAFRDEPEKYTPYLATWLNGECWAERLEQPKQGRRKPSRDEANFAMVGQLAEIEALRVAANRETLDLPDLPTARQAF